MMDFQSSRESSLANDDHRTRSGCSESKTSGITRKDRSESINSKNTCSSKTSRNSQLQYKKSALPYKKGSSLLCYYDNLLWDVVVMKYDNQKNRYLIHYINYGAEYDEWVKPCRLKLVNKKTRLEQQKLNKIYEEAMSIEEKERLSKDQWEMFTMKCLSENLEIHGFRYGSTSNDSIINLVTYINHLDENHCSLQSKTVYDHMSSAERVVSEDKDMICDCELVTILPHSPSIRKILHDFFISQAGSCLTRQIENLLLTVACATLNKMFPSILYGAEITQYSNLISRMNSVCSNPNIELVDIYGAKHLLRVTDMLPIKTDNNSVLTNILSEMNNSLQRYVVENVKLESIIYTNQKIDGTLSQVIIF